jgi:hypothetical protein
MQGTARSGIRSSRLKQAQRESVEKSETIREVPFKTPEAQKHFFQKRR